MEISRPLSILLVGKDDGPGGAQRASLLELDGLNEQGMDAWLAVDEKVTHHPRVLPIPQGEHRGPWARGWTNLARAASSRVPQPGLAGSVFKVLSLGVGQPLRVLNRRLGHEDFDHPATARLPFLPPRTPDILHLHNLHENYFDLRALPALSAAIPTFVSLHDAWLLTGHCAYPGDCPRFAQGCGCCPDLARYPSVHRDATRRNLRVKADIFARSRLHVVAPSAYLLDQARASVMAPAMVDSRMIANGLDTTTFRPGDRAAARRALKLPPDAQVVLCGSAAPSSGSYKDPATAWATARLLGAQARPNALVFLFAGTTGEDQVFGSVRVVRTGYIREPARMALHHQAADVLLHTALTDNAPFIIHEALCCGAKVVATRTGGIPGTLTVAREAGIVADTWLVPKQDPAATAAALTEALAAPTPPAPSPTALDRLSVAAATRHILAYFHDVLGHRSPNT